MRKSYLILALTSVLLVAIIISSVEGKPQLFPIAKPYPSCDMNYTDITAGIMQRLMQAQVSSGKIYVAPKEISQRFFSINLRDNSTLIFDSYLYDIGLDELWNTRDDRAYHIIRPYRNEMIDIDTIAEINGIYEYFWVTSNIQGGKDINHCDISNQGCANPQIISSIQGNVLNMLISVPQQRLYLAIEDPNVIFSGNIYSCSLQTNSSDSCLSPISSFINHTSFNFFEYSINNEGFFIRQAPSMNLSFFNINNHAMLYLPQSNYISKMIVQIPSYGIISHLPQVSNNPSKIIFLDLLSGASTQIYPLSTNISIESIDLFMRGIGVVYTKTNPYRQIIRIGQNPETEVFRGNPNTSPIPLTLQSDYSIIGVYPTNNDGIHIYRSNCKG